MHTNIQTTGTWRNLLNALQTLSDEQLDCHMVACAEDQSFLDVALQVTTEPHYQDDPHEGYTAESKLLSDGLDAAALEQMEREEAGAVYISLG